MLGRNPFVVNGDPALIEAAFAGQEQRRRASLSPPPVFLHAPYAWATPAPPPPRPVYISAPYAWATPAPLPPQPLVLPPGPRASPVVYKPVPVVYQGDRVVLAGAVQFPLPSGVDASMDPATLSRMVSAAVPS